MGKPFLCLQYMLLSSGSFLLNFKAVFPPTSCIPPVHVLWHFKVNTSKTELIISFNSSNYFPHFRNWPSSLLSSSNWGVIFKYFFLLISLIQLVSNSIDYSFKYTCSFIFQKYLSSNTCLTMRFTN